MPHYQKPRSSFGRVGRLAESIFGEVPMPAGTSVVRPAAGILAQRPAAMRVLDNVMSGAEQIMPSPRDAMQMIQRLRGGMSRVPASKGRRGGR